MLRYKILTKGKETIYTRVARKDHICHECKGTIFKGCAYIEDHINYLTRTGKDGSGFKKWYVNKICLLCWRGEVP